MFPFFDHCDFHSYLLALTRSFILFIRSTRISGIAALLSHVSCIFRPSHRFLTALSALRCVHRNTYRVLSNFRAPHFGTLIVFSKTPDRVRAFSCAVPERRLVISACALTRRETPYRASYPMAAISARTRPDDCAPMRAMASSALSRSTHQCEVTFSSYTVSPFFAPYLARACSRTG